MQRCRAWYAPSRLQRVVDVGSANVNGSYRRLFGHCAEYIGVDLEAGPGVDLVLETPYLFPLPDDSADLVISGQMLEHCPQFWRVFTEIARIMKPEAILFMIAPSAGPIHRYPVDCYRYYPDAYQALAEWSGLRLVDCWLDERGPWRDLVGVFQKGVRLEKIKEPKPPPPPPALPKLNAPPDAEVTRGARPYLDVLADLHRLVAPKLYLEIGVRRGNSLSLAQCKSIAVDPYPELASRRNDLDLYTVTSDDFFFFNAKTAITQPIDFAFIDGMHLAEFVYRDFMNLEPYMSPNGVIVIDDVLPNHPLQAGRKRETANWCGDVWRFADTLATLRRDLKLTWLDSSPTGLLIVSQLKRDNRALFNQYNRMVNRLNNAPAPPSVLKREKAIPPTEEALRSALHPPR
jgi:hypothetical protein